MTDTIRIYLGVILVTASTTANAQFEYVTNAGGTTLTITGYSGSPGVVIPSAINGLTVTSIGDFAFAVDSVTSVTIADSVTNIGEEAFDGCSSLTNLVIPDSVIEMDYAAFGGCSMTSVIIPASVNGAAGYGAFADCEGLTNVTFELGLTIIQPSMFGGCHSLTNVTIPSSVTNIGDNAFSQCTALTQVFFTGNAPMVDNTVFEDFYITGIGPDVPYYTATAYYLPGTTGWAEFSSNTFIPTTNIYIPAVLWNPTMEASGPNFGVVSNQFGFNITGTSNIPIVLEACTNLAQPDWVPLQSMTLTNGSVSFSEPLQTNSPARFYRIIAP
jgi:hypothetical protein